MFAMYCMYVCMYVVYNCILVKRVCRRVCGGVVCIYCHHKTATIIHTLSSEYTVPYTITQHNKTQGKKLSLSIISIGKTRSIIVFYILNMN